MLRPFLLLGLGISLSTCQTPDPCSPPRPPNILHILADDLGYGELGCYGQKKIRTPNLDSLAAQGMSFRRHYSGSPVCAPSRCVLLTGKHTGHSIVRNNTERGGWGTHAFGLEAEEGQFPLPARTPTLSRSLQGRGYRTGAFGKWGLGGPGTEGHPNAQGFDRFFGYLCQRKAHSYYPTHLWSDGDKYPLRNEYIKEHQKLDAPLDSPEAYYQRFTGPDYACDVILDKALDFIRENKDEAFFLHYASPIPHVALQIPPERLEEYPEEWDDVPYLGQKSYAPHPYPRRAYAAMITQLDREVGALLALLRELGLDDNTIVVFTSDNGPTFNGGTDRDFFDSAAGLREGKNTLYEGGIRVPMIVRWPGRIEAGTRTDHLSGFQDHYPSILELVGAAPSQETDGISFAPTLLGRTGQRQHDYLYWEYGRIQALRLGPSWKALAWTEGRRQGTFELYDLEADPAEKDNVAEAQPELRAKIEALFRTARTPSKEFPLKGVDPASG